METTNTPTALDIFNTHYQTLADSDVEDVVLDILASFKEDFDLFDIRDEAWRLNVSGRSYLTKRLDTAITKYDSLYAPYRTDVVNALTSMRTALFDTFMTNAEVQT